MKMVKLFCAIVGVAGSAYGVEVARGAVDDLEDAIRKKSSDRIECDDQLQLFLAMMEGPEWLSSMDPDVISMRSGYQTIHVLVNIPKHQWKRTVETLYSLDSESLYFVSQEQAAEQLCQVHNAVFIGAGGGPQSDAWPIALTDNERGLGKTAIGNEYIRRCRE
ncbi:hypothetical protein PF005_g21761 [Phytophthora fragariae]|uniref:Crinkler effector protein N-terminal domain-containing protein n=1 Tax=Phytophthora fragariae TaxID=53985 RepID=A0A6A3WFN1_9STRA|nr:hypothetical protein PF005_g21761 [Phytophthora fragariae]